jgi:23S rRNA (adenine2503-C2)-methyltransferase
VKEDIIGVPLEGLLEICENHKFPKYTAQQLCEWLYHRGVRTFGVMTNIPMSIRNLLDEKFQINLKDFSHEQISADGTRKFLFPVQNKNYVETVMIPDGHRATICISSQAGCKMECIFCMTGKMGFMANLSAAEILNQVMIIREKEKLSNYVFMGMGEPMTNTDSVLQAVTIMTASYGLAVSPSRITISTVGLIPGMEKILQNSRCHLAVSLNSPFESERVQLMPVEKAFPIRRVVDFIKKSGQDRQRRISFEYILLKNVNDTARHINGLTKLLNGLRCRINLIRYHEIPNVALHPSDEETVQWFKSRLNEKGLLTTIRASRGEDIHAACGMLSARKL